MSTAHRGDEQGGGYAAAWPFFCGSAALEKMKSRRRERRGQKKRPRKGPFSSAGHFDPYILNPLFLHGLKRSAHTERQLIVSAWISRDVESAKSTLAPFSAVCYIFGIGDTHNRWWSHLQARTRRGSHSPARPRHGPQPHKAVCVSVCTG